MGEENMMGKPIDMACNGRKALETWLESQGIGLIMFWNDFKAVTRPEYATWKCKRSSPSDSITHYIICSFELRSIGGIWWCDTIDEKCCGAIKVVWTKDEIEKLQNKLRAVNSAGYKL